MVTLSQSRQIGKHRQVRSIEQFRRPCLAMLRSYAQKQRYLGTQTVTCRRSVTKAEMRAEDSRSGTRVQASRVECKQKTKRVPGK